MLQMLTNIAAVVPGLLLCWLIFRVDRYEREGLWPLLLCLLLGALATLPAINIERWFIEVFYPQHKSFATTLLLAFGVVAANEELFKFGALLLGAFPYRFFNEPMDGIVYAVMVGMGFATVENLAYADRFGLETVLVRSLTAVPAHLVFSIVMGYYLGKARFRVGSRFALMAKGFLIPFILHGIYDFLIIQEMSAWLTVLGALSVYLGLYYARLMINDHLDHSPFRK